MRHYGANGGLASLAGFGVFAIAGSFVLPDSLARLPKPDSGSSALPLAGLVGLASVFFYLAGIVGLWVFAEQIGTGGKIAPDVVGFAVAASFAAQIAGSLLATVSTGKINPSVVLLVCCAANLAIILVLGGGFSTAIYVGAIVLFGFLWMLAMPFQTRMLLDVDPTRRTAMFLSAAQLFGSAAGPLVTSAFAGAGLGGALRADAVLFLVCAGLATGIFAAGRRLSV